MSRPGPGLFVRCLERIDTEIEGCESVDVKEMGFCGKLRSSGRGILFYLEIESITTISIQTNRFKEVVVHQQY